MRRHQIELLKTGPSTRTLYRYTCLTQGSRGERDNSNDSVELVLSQVHGLWRKFSERFGVKWVKLETGIRQALEVAARQAVLDRTQQCA
ncbi:MAG TPA: hypothetical protein VFF81_12190 [Noviherbaspirillum sp.]|nr:hypothetical protein [Noviherbaspirillum sp.]